MGEIVEETKKIISSILVSSPLQCTVSKLNLDFKDIVGYEIPYKEMGYNSLLHYLHSIPTVIRVNGQSYHSEVTLVVSEKTAHVNDLVLKQKVVKPRGRPGKRPPQRYSSNHYQSSQYHQYSNQHLQRPLFPRPLLSHPVIPPLLALPFCKPSYYSDQSYYTDPQSRNYPSQQQSNAPTTFRPPSASSPKSTGTRNSGTTVKNAKPTQPATKLNVSTIEDRHPKAISATRKTKDGETATISASQDSGYFKSDKFDANSSKTSFVHYKLKSAEDNNVEYDQDVTFAFKTGDTDEDTNQGKLHVVTENSLNIPKELQINLKKLIGSFPHGIWCRELPSEYRKSFKKDLNYEEFGYRCLLSMCIDLKQIFHCEREAIDDYKLYDKSKPLPEMELDDGKDVLNESTSVSVAEDIISAANALPPIDWREYAYLMPEGVVCFGDELESQFVSEDTKVGDVLKVVVAEIYDPSKVWLYLDNGELDTLMDEMQEFYNEKGKRYLISEFFLEVGLYCVVMTLNEYHRAIITNMLPEYGGFVKIFCIDYGTVVNVSRNSVWYLTKEFSMLPRQAIRARMACIYPPIENTTWSRESAQRLGNLTCMKHISARLAKINREKEILEVYLISNTTNKFINDILVDEGFALSTSQERQKSIKDTNAEQKVKYIHLFPTFREIEYAVVPTSSDMNQFINCDISLDFCIPQYFNKPSDDHLIPEIEKKQTQINLYLQNKSFKSHFMKRDLKKILTPSEDLYKSTFGSMFDELKDQLKELKQNIPKDLETSINGSVNRHIRRSFKDAKEKFTSVGLDEKPIERDEYETFLNKLRSRNQQNPMSKSKARFAEDDASTKPPVVKKITNPFLMDTSSLDIRNFSATNPFICNMFDIPKEDNKFNAKHGVTKSQESSNLYVDHDMASSCFDIIELSKNDVPDSNEATLADKYLDYDNLYYYDRDEDVEVENETKIGDSLTKIRSNISEDSLERSKDFLTKLNLNDCPDKGDLGNRTNCDIFDMDLSYGDNTVYKPFDYTNVEENLICISSDQPETISFDVSSLLAPVNCSSESNCSDKNSTLVINNRGTGDRKVDADKTDLVKTEDSEVTKKIRHEFSLNSDDIIKFDVVISENGVRVTRKVKTQSTTANDTKCEPMADKSESICEGTQTSEGDFVVDKQVIVATQRGAPPGFGPVPQYGIPGTNPVSVYSAWSTTDYYSNLPGKPSCNFPNGYGNFPNGFVDSSVNSPNASYVAHNNNPNGPGNFRNNQNFFPNDPVNYVGGPGNFGGGPGNFINGPGNYANGPCNFINVPGNFANGPGNFVGGPGNFVSGPGNFVGGPGNFVNGPGNFDNGPGNFVNGPGNFVNGPGNFVNGPGNFPANVRDFNRPMPQNWQQSSPPIVVFNCGPMPIRTQHDFFSIYNSQLGGRPAGTVTNVDDGCPTTSSPINE